MEKIVIYTRISSKNQSLNSLSNQEQFCKSFAEQNGGEVIAVYSEVESGYNNKKRIELNNAIDKCKKNNATLIVSDIDRIARNVALIKKVIYNAGINVIIASNPNADYSFVSIYAAQAQEESRIRSERTKRALQAKKRRGEVWNKQNGSAELVSKMTAARIEKARSNPNSQMAATVVKHMKANGASLRAIAAELNKAGFKTPSGKIGKFTPTTVKNMVKRFSL
jgi:DNA invertase Pin-like site-specific DNA recombinase